MVLPPMTFRNYKMRVSIRSSRYVDDPATTNLLIIMNELTRTCCQLTVLQIAHATVRKLSDVKGISEAKVTKLKEIVKAMVPMDFRTAADALEDRKYVLSFSWRRVIAGLMCE